MYRYSGLYILKTTIYGIEQSRTKEVLFLTIYNYTEQHINFKISDFKLVRLIYHKSVWTVKAQPGIVDII